MTKQQFIVSGDYNTKEIIRPHHETTNKTGGRWGRIKKKRNLILENSCHTPDGLVGEPARVTLVEAVLKSSSELYGWSDGGASGATRLHSSRKIQTVAAGVSSVVEHHTWRENRNHFSVGLYSHFKFFFSQYPQCYSLNTHDSWIMWHSCSGFICLFFKEGILQYPWALAAPGMERTCESHTAPWCLKLYKTDPGFWSELISSRIM